MNFKTWLSEKNFQRDRISHFLDSNKANWARFDSELGYVLGDCDVKDGVDDCITIGHYSEKTGERKSIAYNNQKCRINTYGNSFTQCHQVSDGETWQEYLASHLGEPIRNFGIGGYGVHQAYKRMLRHENQTPSEYIIFYIWGDDHQRSLMPYRGLFLWDWWKGDTRKNMFHANPWSHLEFDLKTKTFIETNSVISKKEELYNLCDANFVYNSFKDNLIINLLAWSKGINDVNISNLEELATWLNYSVDFKNCENRYKVFSEIFQKLSYKATFHTLEKIKSFAETNNKKLLICLGYPMGEIQNILENKTRCDENIINYLHENKYKVFDIQKSHIEDYNFFKISPEEYTKRYYIGHYNPKGNHFFAFSIKDIIVNWLNPKPRAYADFKNKSVSFEGYLN